MKALLQKAKQALKGVFPLRLNSTVQALEEDLESAKDAYWAMLAKSYSQDSTIESLTRINNSYRRDNMHLTEVLRGYQQELENEWKKQYRSFVPQVEAQTEYDAYVTRLRITIPPFHMVSAHDVRHLSDSYIDYFANRLANDVAAASAAKTKEVLLNARCKGI